MKWVVRFLGLMGALGVLLVGLLIFLPVERIARIATDQLSVATGRQVSINGDVAVTLWPVLGVSADDLEIANPEWASDGPMFQAASAAIGVDALSLLRGDIRITGIEARSPTVRIEHQQNRGSNWQFAAPETSTGVTAPADTTAPRPEPEQDAPAVSLSRLMVSDATVIYEAEGRDRVSVSGVDLSLDWPDPAGPAEISASLDLAQAPVRIDIAFDKMADFIAGQVSPVQARLETAAGRLTLSGRGSSRGAVAGALSFVTADTDGFLRTLGLPGADFPAKLGRAVDLSTEVTLTPDRRLALRELRVDLGGNSLTGAADISFDGIPQVNAQFDVGALDLSAMARADNTQNSGSGGTASPASTAPDGWSRAPIDASALAAFNGDIALNAQSIDLGSLRLGKTRAVLRNDTARMVFELREVAAYEGSITGEFVVNNRNGLSVGGKIDAVAIQMQPFLADALAVRRLTGQGDLELSFLGSGASVDAIMRSLSGQGALSVGRGTITGINLDQLLRGGATSGTTIFDDLTASWTIASGVLTNRDLLLELKNYRASGAGEVGLGARDIDYRFTPVALRANSGNGLAIPVVFSGPWSDVSIRPDVEAAFDLELDAQKDALEQRAKEKISEKLGVTDTEGKSTEDAVKDAVKDELLRKLFD